MKINIKELKIYMISPASGRYKDRCEISLQRLRDIGFSNIELFISIPAANGTESLTKTQYAILKKELDNEEPFIVVEDDLGIYTNFEMIEVPDNYDAIYLGVAKWVYPYSVENIGQPNFHIHHNKPEDVKDISDKLVKINGMTGTHAILFKGREFMRTIIETMERFDGQRMYSDLMMAVNHKHFNVYALKEPLVYQDAEIGGQQDPTYLTFYEGCYRYVGDVDEYIAGIKPLWN